MFANKQDMPNAMPVSELTDKLGLQHLRSRTVRIWSPLHWVQPFLRSPRLDRGIKVSSSTLVLIYFSLSSYSGTSRPPALPKAQACMMGWTGCPMSCQSVSQPGAGPCCPEAPACIPG